MGEDNFISHSNFLRWAPITKANEIMAKFLIIYCPSEAIKIKVLFSRASTSGEAGDKFKTLSKPK